ncbi:MAG: diacylglycerol kinase [Gammaproteobacteria bacterium]|nr:diacylglycerol kinase [Gammaproteobacteria bacterium]
MAASQQESSGLPSPEKRLGIARIIRATDDSIAGLRAAFKYEAAFRQEIAFAVVLVPAAFFVGRTLTEVALLLTTLFIVLIVELLNSGIETITDRVGLEKNELSGRAKDLGSAAVLMSLLLVVVVWSLVLLSRLIE